MMTVTSLNSYGNITCFFFHSAHEMNMKYIWRTIETARKIKEKPFLHNKSMKQLYLDTLSSDVSLICRQNIFLSFILCFSSNVQGSLRWTMPMTLYDYESMTMQCKNFSLKLFGCVYFQSSLAFFHFLSHCYFLFNLCDSIVCVFNAS